MIRAKLTVYEQQNGRKLSGKQLAEHDLTGDELGKVMSELTRSRADLPTLAPGEGLILNMVIRNELEPTPGSRLYNAVYESIGDSLSAAYWDELGAEQRATWEERANTLGVR